MIRCPSGQRYYGVRFAKNCDPSDLWVSYFTSSRHIKKMIVEHGIDAFSFEVRKIFDDKEAAIKWEHRVLLRLKVRTNKNWVNVTTSESWRSMEGDLNPSKRPEVRAKISKANKGRLRPDQSLRMKTNHPMKNPETAAKMSGTRKKKFASGELVSWTAGKKRPEVSGEKHHRFGKTFDKLGDMNRKEYLCPHCGKLGRGPGMKRYHFDNCKALNNQSA